MLKLFRNIENVRLVLEDVPDHLDGCFTREQYAYIRSQYDMNKPKDSRYCPTAFYTSDTDRVPRMVIEAMKIADLKIKDLRFSDGATTLDPYNWDLRKLTSSLRTLRVAVTTKHLAATPEGSVGGERTILEIGLESLTQLEDKRWINDSYYAMLIERTSGNFRVTSGAKLRRFALEGDWSVSQTHLLQFVKQHASSLCCFILYGSVIDSHWTSALRAIADATRGRLEYISFLLGMTLDAVGEWDDFCYDKYEGEAVRLRH
jgi:hypothetical protein